jgi:hypothetical protein
MIVAKTRKRHFCSKQDAKKPVCFMGDVDADLVVVGRFGVFDMR